MEEDYPGINLHLTTNFTRKTEKITTVTLVTIGINVQDFDALGTLKFSAFQDLNNTLATPLATPDSATQH